MEFRCQGKSNYRAGAAPEGLGEASRVRVQGAPQSRALGFRRCQAKSVGVDRAEARL